MSILCCQPNACSLPGSVSLRMVPSGLLLSKVSFPRYPTVSAISSARRRMVISLPVPMLMWQLRISFSPALQVSLKSTCSMTNTLASAISSLQRNSRSGVPVPHNLTSPSPMPYLASMFSISSLLLPPSIPSTGRRFMSRRTASQSPCCRQWARCILRIMAGSTWLRSRSKLSLGPYRLVGMTAM